MRLFESLVFGTLILAVLLTAMLAPVPHLAPRHATEGEDVCDDWYAYGLCMECD